MLKQSLIYLLLSIIIVVFAHYAQLLLVYIVTFYTYLNVKIAPIFSYSKFAIIVRQVLVLVLIPVILTGIPALIYRAVKGRTMPYFHEIIWLLWLIIVISKILIL